MEQLKHSEEEILKLGKKLLAELDLTYTVNTLARWMGHYLADLIYKIDKCESEEEKAKLKKECYAIILEIWEKRERIPIAAPTERLKPIIDVISLLKKNEHPFIRHRFLNNNNGLRNKNSSWLSFLEIIKNNSERIYRKSLISMISEELLEKDKEWIEEHSSFLSDDEKSVVEYLDSIKEIEISFIDDSENEITKKDMVENLFNELEELINEQKEELLRLKKITLNTLKKNSN
ncbi:hypothetical protein [Gillisia limnaea]|uniref:Uncharacterized protein n=1 Tax=Gillisia limnaea (strain DSM 15749 / LMG 21470 / R-8282) TaxID=865937 RepID=H2BTK5_GILLR|nr:hypothetical protein [Gillisia limnaea]EHQ01591.1 hypothetical protein Gilli_0903 [Gillisia limnaea DSM 15749]